MGNKAKNTINLIWAYPFGLGFRLSLFYTAQTPTS